MEIFMEKYGPTLIPRFLVIFCIMMSVECRAHALEYTVSETSAKPTVDFHYSDGSPASYAEVKVWSPGNDSIEFQNGRTDKNGKFSFVPDQDGLWRVTISDGMGHAAEVEQQIMSSRSGVNEIVPHPTEKKNRLLYTVLGCSLIMNLGFIIRGLRWKTDAVV